jgi:hypothetical protein
MDELNGRRVCIWERDGDPYRNLDRLVTAITESAADLFNIDGALFWLKEGELIQVGGAVLPEIIRTFVVTKTIRNIGTADAPIYERRFIPFEADVMVVRALIKHGDLLNRVPKIGAGNVAAELPRWATLEIVNQR